MFGRSEARLLVIAAVISQVSGKRMMEWIAAREIKTGADVKMKAMAAERIDGAKTPVSADGGAGRSVETEPVISGKVPEEVQRVVGGVFDDEVENAENANRDGDGSQQRAGVGQRKRRSAK